MKIGLIGYGKMGKTIAALLQKNYPEHEVALIIHEDNLSEFTIENLQKIDVAIEFSTPHTAVNNILKCFEAGTPVVVGTTAWLQDLDKVTAACTAANGSLFYSPNFSIGVNIFFEINKKLAAIMQHQPQYKVGIEEIHHTEKLDAPSGTAIKTAEVILENYALMTNWELAAENLQKNENKLLITAKREPNVPGTHTVTYLCDEDELSFTHQAYNRNGFANGAITAAIWLVGKKGIYQMKDLLSF